MLIEEEKNVLTQMKDAGISKLEKIELRTRLRKLISEETDIKNLPDSVLFQDVHADYDCKLTHKNDYDIFCNFCKVFPITFEQ